MQLAYKYRLYPTEAQKIIFAKNFGCVRYVYNKALALKKEAWETKKDNISIPKQIQPLLAEWKKQEEMAWLKEACSISLVFSLRSLDDAFKKFFKEHKKGVGYPKFKSAKNPVNSFQAHQGIDIHFHKKKDGLFLMDFGKIKDIPVLVHRKVEGKIKTTTISKDSTGAYWVSFITDKVLQEVQELPLHEEKTIGIDLGIKSLITRSDKEASSDEAQAKADLKKLEKRLKRVQRKLSKQIQPAINKAKATKEKAVFSKNSEKTRLKVAKIHAKIANKRDNYIHKLTHEIACDDNVHAVCLEDLNVKGMLKNSKLAKAISNASFHRFKTVLEYKLKLRGKRAFKIDRFEPSSKKCNACGAIKEDLKLRHRNWTCQNCGEKHDRDKNASINIKKAGWLKALGVCNAEAKSVENQINPKVPRKGNARGSVKQKIVDEVPKSPRKEPTKRRNKTPKPLLQLQDDDALL
jgi:putative transposase